MEKTTITVEVSESSFLDQGKFRRTVIVDKLRKAGIPAKLSDVTGEVSVVTGVLDSHYSIANHVLTLRWTGAVSAIVEDIPKPYNTGELMNAWRSERYELGQLLRKIKPHLTKINGYKEFRICLGYGSEATERQLAELKEVVAQIEVMINKLPEEKP